MNATSLQKVHTHKKKIISELSTFSKLMCRSLEKVEISVTTLFSQLRVAFVSICAGVAFVFICAGLLWFQIWYSHSSLSQSTCTKLQNFINEQKCMKTTHTHAKKIIKIPNSKPNVKMDSLQNFLNRVKIFFLSSKMESIPFIFSYLWKMGRQNDDSQKSINLSTAVLIQPWEIYFVAAIKLATWNFWSVGLKEAWVFTAIHWWLERRLEQDINFFLLLFTEV